VTYKTLYNFKNLLNIWKPSTNSRLLAPKTYLQQHVFNEIAIHVNLQIRTSNTLNAMFSKNFKSSH